MTASRPDTALPLDVHGELRLEGPSSSRVALRAEGALLRLAVPGWATLHAFGPRSLLARRRGVKLAIRALRRSGLTLHIDVNGRRAFGLGDGVRTTLLARMLGLASTDIRWSNLLSLLRSRGAARDAGRR